MTGKWLMIMGAAAAALSRGAFVVPDSPVNFATTYTCLNYCADVKNGAVGNFFDGSTTSRCMTPQPNPDAGIVPEIFLTFDNTAPVVNCYRFYFNESSAGRAPKTWTLSARSAYNDDWIPLDTRLNETGWSTGQTRVFMFTNENPYAYYKFTFTANNGAIDYMSLHEIYIHHYEETTTLAVQGNYRSGSPSPGYGAVTGLAADDEVALALPTSPVANLDTGDRYTFTGFRIEDFAGNTVFEGTGADLPYTYTYPGAYRKLIWLWDGQSETLRDARSSDITVPSQSGVNEITAGPDLPAEPAAHLFDADTGTRWRVARIVSAANPVWVNYRFLTVPRVVNAFRLNNNYIERTPRDFEFLASLDGENWISLAAYSQVGVLRPTVANTVFAFENDRAYPYYRLLTTATRSTAAGAVQATDLQFLDYLVADALRIASNARAVGTPDPFYGYEESIENGAQIVCQAPDGVIAVSDTERLACNGYALSVDGGAPVTNLSLSATYVHAAGAAATLRWLFGAEYFQEISTEGEGSVDAASHWKSAGQTVTVRVSSGELSHWEGNIGDADPYDDEISWVVDGARSVKAVFASDWYVAKDGADTNGGRSAGDAFATLEKALSEAGSGSRIHVGEGTFTNASAALVVGPHVAILGAEPEKTVIRGAVAGGRVFEITGAAAVVSSVAIEGGTTADGYAAGVKMQSGTLTNCIVRGCSASGSAYGGGIFSTGNEVLITGCVVSNNLSDNTGSGIYLLSGTVRDSLVACNNGTGLYIPSTASGVSVFGSEFASNTGHGVATAFSLTISNCVMRGNLSSGALLTASPSLVDCLVSENKTPSGYSGRGGGVWVSGNVTLRRCTVTGNHSFCTDAVASGGGLYVESGTLTARDCLVAGNTAEGLGGAVSSKGDVRLVNCTLTGNTSASAAVDHYSGTFYCDNTIIALNTDNASSDALISDRTPTQIDSSFLGGDPRFTAPSKGDYTLRPGSPCVDGGSEAAYGEPLASATDLAGSPRQYGLHLDIGCFECQQSRGLMMIVR